MNEKYLWDKTGEDFEIEKLENSLKSMRYRETTAPLLLVKTAVEKKSSFGFFRFAVPAMACLVIALLALGFWLKSSNLRPDEIAENVEQSQSIIQTNDESVHNPPPTSNIEQTVKYVEKPTARRRLNKLPKVRPAYVRVNTVTAQKVKKANSADVLTKEERYAYDQLMTALAITSSQFKLVRDKVHGIENQTAEVKSGQ